MSHYPEKQQKKEKEKEKEKNEKENGPNELAIMIKRKGKN
jgi:hypothetical protein